ncbi:hypothetical protein SLS56_009340 [Neofusicoccum ribis]|uniref:Rad60/SUMO-like domain-containing protein n=1 Tax=Neofusicoccum ribis TaxID=45134 RepID=A0ABR3SIF5_9PEZI
MADSASAASGAPPKQKRSFFKKPSWKQKLDNADDDDPTAMFDGSRQTFSAIMEEQERARKKKLQEQEEQARRKELGAARQGKRRKVVRDEDHHSSGEDSAPARRDDRKERRSSTPVEKASPVHLSPSPPHRTDATSLSSRYEAAAKAGQPQPKAAVVIDLDDSDSESGVSPPVTEAAYRPTQTTSTDLDDDVDESDLEIREIILETRRKQRLAREQHVAHASPPDQQGSSPGIARCGSTPLSPAPPDPPVQIFITSRIPGTKPLIVTRRLRQRLQEVREAWCKRQGFNEEMTDSVFFTFKGRRLFDVATCTSLGLVADSFGNVYMKDNREWDENDGRITVEAVTLDIYNDDMREMKRQREVEPAPEPEPEPEPKRIKAIIKTKDFGDAKFTCGPETTFEKLTGSSMLRLKLSADKRPYLLFDGERLDPTGTMADLDDFEDGDALEMHFD